MSFDVQAAQKAGYTQDEILQHLTESRKFDIQGALNSGYSKDEIINHLASIPSSKPSLNTFLPKGTYGNEPQGTAAYLPEEAANAASGIGKGIITTAQDSSDLINKIASFIPQSLHEPIKKYALSNPALAPIAGALGVVSKISPTISKLETSVGAQPGALTTANNPTEKVGKFIGQVGMAAFPAEEAIGGLVGTGTKLLEKKGLQTAIEAVTPELKGKSLAAHYMQDFGAGAQKAGILTNQTKSVSPEITQVAGELKDVLTSREPLINLKNLGTEMNKTEGQLTDLLAIDHTPVIKQDVIEQLDTLRKNIPEEFQAIKDQKNVFNRVISYAQKMIENMTPESSGNLENLREARIKFDTQAKAEFPSAFNPSGTINVSSPAGRAIKLARDLMNKEAYLRSPNGSDIQALIKRESDIFKAGQIIAEKVGKNEGKTILERLVGSVKKHPVITAAGIFGTGAGVGKLLK